MNRQMNKVINQGNTQKIKVTIMNMGKLFYIYIITIYWCIFALSLSFKEVDLKGMKGKEDNLKINKIRYRNLQFKFLSK